VEGRRAAERATAETIAALRSGNGRVLLVAGAAGLGKSHLLAGLADEAAAAGAAVRAARAHEVDTVGAPSIVVDALGVDAAAAPRGPSVPSPSLLAGNALADAEAALVDACLDAVEALTAGAPLLVALDDFQWAGRADVAIVHALARRAERLPLAVAIALRPHPRGRELARLVDEVTRDGATVVGLDALEGDDVVRLLEHFVGAPPGPRLRALAAQLGGNPFYVRTLVDALAAEGALEAADGRVEAANDALPAELRDLVLRRLASLDVRAIELLQVAAVLGTTVDVRELAGLLGERTVSLLGVVERCRRAGVLRRDGAQLRFAHDLVREAVYADVPLDVRRAMHDDAAALLAGAGAAPERVAWHRVAATPDDPGHAAALVDEARVVVDRAPAAAAILATRAGELAGGDTGRAVLVHALARCGRADEALAVARAAAGAGPELRSAAAYAALQSGRLAGHDVAATLEAAARDGGERQAAWLVQAALARLLGGDLAGADDLASRLQHDPTVAAPALAVRAWVASFAARVADAVALARAAVEAGTPRTMEWSLAQFFLGMVLVDADRLGEAEAAFTAGLDGAEQWMVPLHVQGRGTARFLAGAWDDAIVDLRSGAGHAEEIGSLTAVGFSHSVLAAAATARGDPDAARDHLDRADRTFASGGAPLGVDWMIWARARLAEQEGRIGDARDALADAWTIDVTLGLRNDVRTFAPDLVRLDVRAGERARARTVVETLHEVAHVAAIPGATGAALRAEAWLRDDPDLAVAAVDDYRAGPRPHDAAMAALDAMELCASHGRFDEAEALLAEAGTGLGALGAAGDVAVATARARACGVRARVPAPAPVTGWDGLTDTERRIAELAAAGCTNRGIGEQLFLSPRTVESHLTRVFAKLGVRSRVELAGAGAGGRTPG
jgi:DNA-binding CsgD family transcriptional regulator